MNTFEVGDVVAYQHGSPGKLYQVASILGDNIVINIYGDWYTKEWSQKCPASWFTKDIFQTALYRAITEESLTPDSPQ